MVVNYGKQLHSEAITAGFRRPRNLLPVTNHVHNQLKTNCAGIGVWLGCLGVLHVTIWYPIGHFLLLVLWFRDIQWRMRRSGWYDLNTTSKQRSRSLILVPIDFSYATSYRLRLSVVTFAPGRTV